MSGHCEGVCTSGTMGSALVRSSSRDSRKVKKAQKPLIFMRFHGVFLGRQHEIWSKQHNGKVRDLAQFVKDNAWGHHASCTCKIGRKDDPMAVLDGDFRVYGARGLRVVDASVFPKIPGFFIVTSVYMIAEKAADVILADVRA
jgi:choline dehydrogenase-like flavoprotein